MVNNSLNKITVLSIGPMDEHQIALAEMLYGAGGALFPNARWQLEHASSLQSALPLLIQNTIPIVICDADCEGGTWQSVLDDTSTVPAAPLLIVTSRVADDRLWAEALNRGAHDVLGKPFHAPEVIRTFNLAWLRWRERHATVPKPPAVPRHAHLLTAIA